MIKTKTSTWGVPTYFHHTVMARVSVGVQLMAGGRTLSKFMEHPVQFEDNVVSNKPYVLIFQFSK